MAFPRGATGYARVNARSPSAFAICDRCGFRYNRTDLVWQLDWAGAQIQNKRILVCTRTCLDIPQEQLRAYALPPDPLPVPYPRPDTSNQQTGLLGLGNDGGVLYLTSPRGCGYPVTDAFLAPGMVWSQASLLTGYTTISVVPGGVPDTSIPDMFFGVVTYLDLLNYGGSNLPTSPPPDGSNQLWNNGGLVCVAMPILPPIPPIPPFVAEFWNDGGVLAFPSADDAAGWPTFPPMTLGAVWNNGLVVGISGGITPDPSAPPLFFGVVTPPELLALGGGNLPLFNPGVVNQLWNNGGEVAISSGLTFGFPFGIGAFGITGF